MNIEKKIWFGGLAMILLTTSAAAPVPKPLPLSAVVVAPVIRLKVAAVVPAQASKNTSKVDEALLLAAEGLRGGSETARSSAEAPFLALGGAVFRPVAASQRCPDGMSWVCHPYCIEESPVSGKCIFWGRACGCE